MPEHPSDIQEEARWQELAVMHLGGEAGDAQQRELVALLRDRPDRQDRYVMICLQARLLAARLAGVLQEGLAEDWWPRQAMRDLLALELKSEAKPVDLTARLDAEQSAEALRLTPVEDASRGEGRRVIVIPWALVYAGFAAAAALVFALAWFALPGPGQTHLPNTHAEAVSPKPESPFTEDQPHPPLIPVVATVTELYEPAWAEAQGKAFARPALGDEVREQDVLALTSGLVELTTRRGAVVVIEGPCEVVLTGDNGVSLPRGTLSAHCPPEAVGFVVQTPTGRIVDLGTEFVVNVDEAGRTETLVNLGSVAVGNGGSTPLTLTSGQSAAIDANTRLVALQDLSRSNLNQRSPQDRLELRRVGIRQASEKLHLTDPPDRAPNHTVADRERVLLIAERQGVLLNDPLEVTTTATGRLTDIEGSSGWLEAQVPMDSYLIHASVSPEDPMRNFAVSISFDRPILGVAATVPHLDGTDAAFGNQQTVYTPNNLDRHLEFGDVLEITHDRRTLRLWINVGTAMDQLRVFVGSER
ncbi:MAG: hypothetical protein AAFY08_00100 [Planctomycetota bacterium]